VDERAGRAFVVSQLGVGRGGLTRDRRSVTVLDATTGSILQTMAVSQGASAIAIDEQTKRAFVARPTDGTVTMIDIAHA
jgi:DNA-binding beta-propeller fold protein YncE